MLVGGAKLQRVPGLMPADNLMEPDPRISGCRALGHLMVGKMVC